MCDVSVAKFYDLTDINRLFSAIRADSDSPYKPPVDFTLDDIKQNDNRVVFVAKDEGQVIGYLDLHCRSSFQADNVATFELGVHPNGRLKGCATSLLEKMLQYVKEDTKLQRLEIGVLKNNHKAKSLFTKIGFSYLNQSHPQGDDMVMNIER